MMRLLMNKAKLDPKRILFPEGDQPNVLRAAQILLDERIAIPVLMGKKAKIQAVIDDLDLDLTGAELFDLNDDPEREQIITDFYNRRQRRGVSHAEAMAAMKHREPYAMVLVSTGRADGLVSGHTKNYSATLVPAVAFWMRASVDANRARSSSTCAKSPASKRRWASAANSSMNCRLD